MLNICPLHSNRLHPSLLREHVLQSAWQTVWEEQEMFSLCSLYMCSSVNAPTAAVHCHRCRLHSAELFACCAAY